MKIVSVRMPDEMLAWLRKRAKAEHIDVSHLVRVLVYRWMDADSKATDDSA